MQLDGCDGSHHSSKFHGSANRFYYSLKEIKYSGQLCNIWHTIIYVEHEGACYKMISCDVDECLEIILVNGKYEMVEKKMKTWD